MKSLGNIRKVILASILTFTMGLTACTVKESENSNNEKETTEVEPKKELTPLEKEISELKDFQKTDKVYDNKDLEPFNKMQGYLYHVSRNGRDAYEIIELIPPTKEGLAELEQFGEDYRLISNVIIPCYFSYSEYFEKWLKARPTHMDDLDSAFYQAVTDEYKYKTDEELNEIFGVQETEKDLQFTLQ